MNILYRYVSRDIIRFFFLILTITVCIFIAIDFLGMMAVYINSGVSLLRAFYFVLLKVPLMITLFIPVAVILSILIVFCLMQRNNELIILKSSGISPYHLLKPVLMSGVAAVVMLACFSEIIVPLTMAKANRIEREEIRKKKFVTSKTMNIWFRESDMIIHIEHYAPKTQTVSGFSGNYFDQNFRLVRRIDAAKGVYTPEEKWLFYDVTEQIYEQKDAGQKRVQTYAEKEIPLAFSPDELKHVMRKSDEMGFSELHHYIRKMESDGYDATRYRVDLHAKIAFPFVCIIMSIMGMGIAATGDRLKSLPLSIGYGLGSVFVYWVLYSFCLSLGYGEQLPPILAAWIANLIFGCSAALVILYAR